MAIRTTEARRVMRIIFEPDAGPFLREMAVKAVIVSRPEWAAKEEQCDNKR